MISMVQIRNRLNPSALKMVELNLENNNSNVAPRINPA